MSIFYFRLLEEAIVSDYNFNFEDLMLFSENSKKLVQDKKNNLETVAINISFEQASDFTDATIPIFTKYINDCMSGTKEVKLNLETIGRLIYIKMINILIK
jgi:hypothetical protein